MSSDGRVDNPTAGDSLSPSLPAEVINMKMNEFGIPEIAQQYEIRTAVFHSPGSCSMDFVSCQTSS